MRAAATALALTFATAPAVSDAAAQDKPAWRLPDRPLPRELKQDGIVVTVTALLAEPVAGFLIGRGFPAPLAGRYAARCVIRVVMLNESAPAPVSYDLRSWRTRRPDGATSAPLTREDWMRQWQTTALSDMARMEFEWSQLPTTLELHRGDSTQGMVSTGLPAGEHFDLLLEWISDGKLYHANMEGIDCAPPN